LLDANNEGKLQSDPEENPRVQHGSQAAPRGQIRLGQGHMDFISVLQKTSCAPQSQDGYYAQGTVSIRSINIAVQTSHCVLHRKIHNTLLLCLLAY